MKKKKRYEFEYTRCISSPEKWYDYCNKMLMKHGRSLEDWVSKEDFIDYQFGYCNDKWVREKNDGIIETEICKFMPCDVQMYLSTMYNFIIEWFDGHGYMYVVEFER